MHPILFTIPLSFTLFGQAFGPFRLYSYGLMLAIGLGLSIYLFARDAGKILAPRLGLAPQLVFQKVFDLGVWVVVSSLLGARIFYVLENHDQFSGKWHEVVFLWQGGLVFYGGLFGALAAGYVWLRVEKWPVAFCFDLVAPYILLGHAIGRIGCYLNGCCYGIVDQVHGVVFPGGEDQQPHLPTQIWELCGDLIIFSLLLWARRWTLRFSWLSFSLYGASYGLLRWGVEFWRRDWDKHYLVVFNSASQAISGILVVISLGVILWIALKRRKVQSSARH